jgi:glutamate--cysteine ligase
VDRAQIIENYVNYFHAGCKSADNLRYGLEAEHFVVYSDSKKAVPYSGEDGVLSLLQELAKRFAGEYWDNGELLGLYNDEAAISLEPGSQLELSVTASSDIAAMEEIYGRYHRLINHILAKRGQELVSEGYQPASLVEEIELLPKKRYEYMDERFRHTGSRGIQMMRGTASCQIAIDYTSEADFIEKYRFAYILTPLLALVCSNSPTFEGRENDNLLLRTEIWRDVDPERCGIVPTVFDPDFSFRKYAEYLLEQAAIFVVEDDIASKSEQKVYEVLEQENAGDEDYLLYLSLVFPDVRLRQYIEIRVAYSMKPSDMFTAMQLIKGLFSDMDNLRAWMQKFPQSPAAIIAAQDALIDKGWEATIYGEPVKELCQQMKELAMKSLLK